MTEIRLKNDVKSQVNRPSISFEVDNLYIETLHMQDIITVDAIILTSYDSDSDSDMSMF